VNAAHIGADGARQEEQLMEPNLRVAAVILAAGSGSRLGGTAKALIRIDGVPLVRRQIDTLRAAGIADILVVTGQYHRAIAQVLAPTGVRLVHNPHAARGQALSVRLGLQAVDTRADAVMVVLCDQPLLTPADLIDLIAAWSDQRAVDHDFMVPWVAGKGRGNPVLASRRVVQSILASGRYQALRDYMDAHPESILRLDTANDHYIVDIDRTQDLVDVAARLGCEVTLPALVGPKP